MSISLLRFALSSLSNRSWAHGNWPTEAEMPSKEDPLDLDMFALEELGADDRLEEDEALAIVYILNKSYIILQFPKF